MKKYNGYHHSEMFLTLKKEKGKKLTKQGATQEKYNLGMSYFSTTTTVNTFLSENKKKSIQNSSQMTVGNIW